MRVRITVYLKELVASSIEQSRKSSPESSKEKRPGLGVESGVESEMALQVMRLLHDSDFSKSEIARALGKAKPTRYLNDLMREMLESGYVVYTLPEKPNSRLQKYRITKKGKAVSKKRDENE